MEIEVKLKYRNKTPIISALKREGFTYLIKNTIKDVYFGQRHTSMSYTKKLYRIREIVGQRTELTLKDQSKNKKHILSRREITVAIDSPVPTATILLSLGCRIIKKSLATKEIWQREKTHVEFIKFFTPHRITYMEIEGPSSKAVQKTINMLAGYVTPVGEEIFSK